MMTDVQQGKDTVPKAPTSVHKTPYWKNATDSPGEALCWRLGLLNLGCTHNTYTLTTMHRGAFLSTSSIDEQVVVRSPECVCRFG